jgi:hypothetical protein
MRTAMLFLVCGACTYPEKEFSLLACSDDPPPKTDKQNVVVGGIVVDAQQQAPLEGVSLTLVNDGFVQIDDPVLSSAAGLFGTTLPIGGAPFDRAYIKAVTTDHLKMYVANPRPIVDDLSLQVGMITPVTAGKVASLTTGASQFTAGTATVFVNVRDCNNDFLSGATITTDSGQRVFYFQGVNPDNRPIATTERGVAMIADVTGSEITITVRFGDETFRPQTYRVEPDAITQLDITP